MYYTYIYLDPRKEGNYSYIVNNITYTFINEPIYVGKGKGKRFKFHKTNKRITNTRNKHLFNKIAKIRLETNQDPIIIKLKDNLSEKEAFNLENNLIKTIGRYDLNKGPLCNHSDGGEGESNKIITNKWRTHSGTFKKGDTPWNKNKKGYKVHTEEHKKELSIIMKEKNIGKTYATKISERKGGTPILQYSLDGIFIKEWTHLRACRSAGFTSIEYGLKTGRRANGYLWKRKIKN